MDDNDGEIADLRARLRAVGLDAGGGAATVGHLPPSSRAAAFQSVDPGPAFGIFILPWVFVWFLLDAGYSTRSRIVGFLWFAACLIASTPLLARIIPHGYTERM